MSTYQVAVIGGGPGGYIAAIQAAKRGLKTVLVEKKELGGTCLNRGCIPTKTLLHSSDVYHEILNSKALGIEIKGDIDYNYKKIAKRKDKVIKQLRSGIEYLVSGNGIDLVQGEAVLTSSNSFKVGDETYEAENIILATGSVPATVPIPGADQEGVVNSDAVLSLESCPENITIIGGGVIGVEFATLFANLGKKVTIIEMMPSILFGNDPDICDTMQYILSTDKGITIETNAKVSKISDDLTVVYEADSEVKESHADLVILAIGRKPDIASLNLDVAGVKTTEKGFIEVNEYMQTNVPNIYAIGDITGKIQLAHVASAQGMVAADHISGLDKKMDYTAIPSCIYTTPEIACVGLTESKAKDLGIEVSCGQFSVSGNGRSLAINSAQGFAKLVCNKNTNEIIGCHIISANATEMISEATLAIQNNLTVDQLGQTVHAHPTVSEIIMEAAHDIHNMSCHKI